MPVVYNPAVVEAIFQYLWNGQTCMNTLWFKTVDDSEPSPVDLAGLAGDLHDWYSNELIPIQGPQCALTEIFLRQAVEEGGVEYTLAGGPTDVGIAGGDPEAGNVTLTVSFRTGLSGRARRGRNYSVGMTKSQQSGGTASSTYVDALEAAYIALFGYINGTGTFEWIVYSQYDGINPTTGKPIPRALSLVTPVTTALVVDDRTDSQRRRLRARGA